MVQNIDVGEMNVRRSLDGASNASRLRAASSVYLQVPIGNSFENGIVVKVSQRWASRYKWADNYVTPEFFGPDEEGRLVIRLHASNNF